MDSPSFETTSIRKQTNSQDCTFIFEREISFTGETITGRKTAAGKTKGSPETFRTLGKYR